MPVFLFMIETLDGERSETKSVILPGTNEEGAEVNLKRFLGEQNIMLKSALQPLTCIKLSESQKIIVVFSGLPERAINDTEIQKICSKCGTFNRHKASSCLKCHSEL